MRSCRITSFFVFSSYVKINFFLSLLLSMVTQPGTSQCWLETLNTSKTKTKSTASVPTLGQIAWICTIPTSKNTGSLSIPFWLSVSYQTEHQLSLLPEQLWSPPRGSHGFHRTVLPAFDLDKEFFPPGIHKEKFSPVVEKMNLTQISDILKRGTGSVLPLWYVLVIFFLHLSVTLTYLFIFYGTQWGGSNASM